MFGCVFAAKGETNKTLKLSTGGNPMRVLKVATFYCNCNGNRTLNGLIMKRASFSGDMKQSKWLSFKLQLAWI